MPIEYSEQQEAQWLQSSTNESENAIEKMKQHFGVTEVTLELTMHCPIGTAYFAKFLKSEYNEENMLCFVELKALSEFAQECAKQPTSQLVQTLKKQLPVFCANFIQADAVTEINIPSTVRKEFLQMQFEVLPMFEVQAVESATRLKVQLDKLKSQLGLNLRDPFSRYLESSTFRELTSIVTSVDYKDAKETLLSASSNAVVLNMVYNHFASDYKAGHPLHIAMHLADMLRIKLLNSVELWTLNGDNLQFNLKSAVEAKATNDTACFSSIEQVVAELAYVDLNFINTDQEKICFFSNVYNIMMLHAVIRLGSNPQSGFGKELFYRKVKYNLGGMEFSLDDIEYGVFKGNQGSTPFFGKRFGLKDSRIKFVISQPVPYMLLNLMDLTSHGPNVRVLQVASMDKQLDSLFNEYVTRTCKVKEESNALNICIPPYLKQLARFITMTSSSKVDEKMIQLLQPILKLETKKKIKLSLLPQPQTLDFTCLLDASAIPVMKHTITAGDDKGKTLVSQQSIGKLTQETKQCSIQ